MNHLKGIPIAEVPADSAISHGNALPLLHEIEVLLEDLIANGKSGSIDLRSLPMLPDDYTQLYDALGQGEVNATLDAMGLTQVRETAVHGVWWVTHYNTDETIIAEFIEVTTVPEILRTHPADMRVGLERLRTRLTSPNATDIGDANA